MTYVFATPQWFYVYSIILEFFFAIITLLVATYAYKVYRLTEERSARLLATAFAFISLSYFLQAIMNFLILDQLDDVVTTLMNLQSASLLNLLGIYLHSAFFIIGLLILAYVTFKIKVPRVFALLMAIVVLTLFFSSNKLFLFYLLSSIILIFIVIHFFENYLSRKNIHTLLMLIAMIFLLFGTFHFILALNQAIFYILGHVLEFISYILIVINLILILQHGKKKR